MNKKDIIGKVNKIQSFFCIDINKLEYFNMSKTLPNEVNLLVKNLEAISDSGINLKEIKNIYIIENILKNNNKIAESLSFIDWSDWCKYPTSYETNMSFEKNILESKENSNINIAIKYLKNYDNQINKCNELLSEINKNLNLDEKLELKNIGFKFNSSIDIFDQLLKILNNNKFKNDDFIKNNVPALLSPKNEINTFYILFSLRKEIIQSKDIELYLNNADLISLLSGIKSEPPIYEKTKENMPFKSFNRQNTISRG